MGEAIFDKGEDATSVLGGIQIGPAAWEIEVKVADIRELPDRENLFCDLRRHGGTGNHITEKVLGEWDHEGLRLLLVALGLGSRSAALSEAVATYLPCQEKWGCKHHSIGSNSLRKRLASLIC